MKYYMLNYILGHPATVANLESKFRSYQFNRGVISWEPPDVVIETYLEMGNEPDDAIISPLYEANAVPLMRKDLLEAVLAAGADNLELYPVILRDKYHNIEYTDYTGVNIVGRIDCLDRKKSEMMGLDTAGGLIPDMVAKKQIDARKADDVLIFRMKDSTGIVVHEKVKRSIEARKIPYMVFHAPDKWFG